ncbi:MAG: nucleoside 2-deoxyribosyltransferase, partial [Alphaproteobacteria bacterium]
IANLTPFRGPGADPGTAFEVGYMTALGKPAFGYTNTPGSTRARIQRGGAAARGADGIWRDADGIQVEDFGLAENLMLAIPVAIRRPRNPRPLGDLKGFEECVRHAAARLAISPRGGAAPTSRPPAGRR